MIALLRCPETWQPLALASATLLAQIETRRIAGELVTRAGNPVEKSMAAGLVREDRKIIYPIRGGIPILLVEEAILLE